MSTPGQLIEEWEFIVEAGKLREFARAVQHPGQADPAVCAPPTFTVVASAGFVERLVVSVLGLDRSRTVHGEEVFEYFAAIRAGDHLLCRAMLISDVQKSGRRGGHMRVVEVAVEYRLKATGELACRETMTSIERQGV